MSRSSGARGRPGQGAEHGSPTKLIFRPRAGRRLFERVKGIEPSFSAWEADVLPLNYTRDAHKCTGDAPFTPNEPGVLSMCVR
jgi:hypothetical protein